MVPTTESVALAYFNRWQQRDVAGFRSLLAGNVTFEGPTGQIYSAEAWIAQFEKLSEVVTSVDIRRMWIDGNDALTWILVHRRDMAPMSIANWTHIESGRVTRVRTTLDPIAPSR